MKKIDGARYKMGSGYRPDEKPIHEVEVKTFCLDRTEVTTSAYEACVQTGACKPPRGKHASYCNAGKADRADHPINCVDWHQATAYCDQAKKRLPTEEEWELAARGPQGRIFPWGDRLTGTELCWNGGPTGGHGAKRGSHTCPVAGFPDGDMTPTGIADMAGNVSEWTSSWACPYDPAQRCDRTSRELRGGSWFFNTEAYVRVTSRGSYRPTDESYFVGFRCASDAP